MVRMKRIALAAVTAASMAVTACSGSAGQTKSSVLQETETKTQESVKQETQESALDMDDSAREADTEAEGGNTEAAWPEGGEEAEIEIVLPDNEQWYSGAGYSVEDDSIRQVAFHDEITDSDVIVRACREADGDPSVFYYMFDDSKKESWSAGTSDGSKIDITVEVTVENSDIHGVLATWEHGGIRYALWEDDGADDVSSVAKLAMEIAKRSGQQTDSNESAAADR